MTTAEQDRLIEEHREGVARAAKGMAGKRGHNPDEAVAEAWFHLVVLFRERWSQYDPNKPGFVIRHTLGMTLNYFRSLKTAVTRESESPARYGYEPDLDLWELLPEMHYPVVMANAPLGIKHLRDNHRPAYDSLAAAFGGVIPGKRQGGGADSAIWSGPTNKVRDACDLGDGRHRSASVGCPA